MSKLVSNCIQNYYSFNSLVFRKFTKTANYSKYLSTISGGIDPKDDNNYDIVINGGGIVGFSALLAIKSSPFLRDKRICLIERQIQTNVKPLDRSHNQFSNRVSSITLSSKKFFQTIGIWDEMKDFAKPIDELYVWSYKYRNAINFRLNLIEDNEDIDEDNEVVCYVIENNRILSALQSKLNDFDHNVCYGTVVTDVKSDDNVIKIDTKCLKNDYINSFGTNLLIGCDGFDSIVRQKSNLFNFEHDLRQLGIVGTLAIEPDGGNPLNSISFQRFVPFNNSVIALLPLNQEFCSFVWSVSKELAEELMRMSEQEFVDHLNDTLYSEPTPSESSIVEKFDEILSQFVPKSLLEVQTARSAVPQILHLIPESRAMFPFKFGTTLPYLVGSPANGQKNNRIALIGDAAHRVHPLAGQGLNLGIGDAKVLIECLHNHLWRGENIFGSNPTESLELENCLFEFERKRQLKSIAMLSAIHSMPQLFECLPSNLLPLFNCSDFLKQRIIKFANSD